MSSITYTDNVTVIPAAWLNDANAVTYSAFGDGTSYTGLLTLPNGQIKFPATQNASANVNTLDDYEEGSWTPSLGGNTTYAAQLGKYTKIGNLVTFKGHISVTLIGTGSTSVISGLPFTSANEDNLGGITVLAAFNAANNFVSLSGYVGQNVATIQITGIAAAGANTSNHAFFGNSAEMYFKGHYYV